MAKATHALQLEHKVPSKENIVVLQHDSAADFLAFAYPTLRLHEHSANIILAQALMRAPAEYVLTECQFITNADVQLPSSSTRPTPATNFWLTVWSQCAKSPPVLDMALSCIDSSFGNCPICLWTPADRGAQVPQWLEPRIREVASYLSACVAPECVFSVFGVTDLVTTFVDVWTRLTGFQSNPKPLYKAFSAVCTPQNLKVTAATTRDVEAAGRLCKNSRTVLARLINKGQLWLGTLMGETASICAVTRSSLHVSAITKSSFRLHSSETRRNGLAQALVKEVTLSGKHSVVVYRIYERVGFQIEDPDIWLELGFVGTNSGHW
ncbi:hypothetical protein B0H13DRAFT_2453854 [Mycena leptocephala]|nr:hypothetical protein B0H13DRAFT_2453854 [Mycena leptocephala]